MDAVEFLKNYSRMCASYPPCSECKANEYCVTAYIESINPEMLVKVVEEWAKEHSARTRQSEFLKIFPNAVMTVADNLKVVAICPKRVDIKFIEPICEGVKCVKCEKDYWLQEIE